MELSDPATPRGSPNMNNAPNRRKSGRVTQKPVLLNKDPNIIQVSTSSGKRKRAESHVDEVEDSSDAERSASSHNESDPDEEELKERRKKTARSRNPPAKSAAKKAKTGPSLTTNLAVRPAVNGVKKTTKPKKSRARPVQDGEDAGTGLYGWRSASKLTVSLIFCSGNIFPRPYLGCCGCRLDYKMGAEQYRGYARLGQSIDQVYWMQA